MKKRFLKVIVLAFVATSSFIFYPCDDLVLIASNPDITIPPIKSPTPTQDKPTKKKLAVISNFDLERNSSAFTV